MTRAYSEKEDFSLLKNAVLEAGALALAGLGKTNLETWLKRGVEPVSEIDLAVNDHLKNVLMSARPDYGWLSEESMDDSTRLDKNLVWVVDPIDGTRAFIKGAKDFSICVALLQGGRPILSVLFAPARDEFFSAMKNRGAFLNNNNIQVGTASRIPGMKLQGDEGYFKNAKRWQTPWPEMAFGKYQSFALRIASVAAGNFDAAISARPKSEWDVAAADLIVTEAGGICCDGEGKAFVYNQKNTRLAEIVATIPGLLPEILERLKGRKPKNTS
ncbi:MAG: 3'(2'),5'-bisphosphate nucleotidase CysQ [Sphingomonadales bacterium]